MRNALVGSVVLHGVLIALAAERSTGPRVARAERERIARVELPRVQSEPPPPEVALAPVGAPPKGYQILVAPVEIPTAIPEVDLTRSATNADDFSGRGIAGGTGAGIGAGGLASRPLLDIAPVRLTEPIDENEVDLRAYMLPGQLGPMYPESLRLDAPDGTVFVRFVVDTSGKIEPPSLSVVSSSHQLFADAVRVALDRLRFSPAQHGGRKVRVRMEQKFEFHLASR